MSRQIPRHILQTKLVSVCQTAACLKQPACSGPDKFNTLNEQAHMQGAHGVHGVLPSPGSKVHEIQSPTVLKQSVTLLRARDIVS